LKRRCGFEASGHCPTLAFHMCFTDHDPQNTGVVPVVTTLPSCLPKPAVQQRLASLYRRFAIVSL
ncbi:hypothetical protein HAX54_017977, partial [Datura stramonium]|nr:hypothetical protein [Datura stramonium]